MTYGESIFFIVAHAVTGTLLTIGFFHCETNVDVRNCRSYFVIGLAGTGFGLLVIFANFAKNTWIPALALVATIQLFAGGSIQVWRYNKRAKESLKSGSPRVKSPHPAEPALAGSAARRPTPSNRPYDARFKSHKKYLQQKR